MLNKLSVLQALREGLDEQMARDPAVFCMGEDISIPAAGEASSR